RVIACDAALDGGDRIYREAGVESMAFDAVVAQADVVSLHVPLVASTRNLFDAARIAAMKRGAILINSARGGIVDEAAVAAALKSGQLGGAALECCDTEPLPAGSPLAGAPNLLLTPHIAGLTQEANARVSTM